MAGAQRLAMNDETIVAFGQAVAPVVSGPMSIMGVLAVMVEWWIMAANG